MYKISRLLYLLSISAGVYACSPAGRNVKGIKDSEKFPSVSVQSETRLVSTELPTPQLMTLYRDSLLLVVNNLNSNPCHVRVFDIKQKKAVNDLFPASSKKGGTLAFMSFGITDSLVWVFDVAKNGFIAAGLNTVLERNARVEYYSEYRITPQVFYYDALLLNRQEALLSGNYDTDEKLVYINFANISAPKVLLSYAKDSAIGSSRFNKMSYESFMLLKPDKQKVLLAGRYSDQFELLSLADGKYKRGHGPTGFAPQLASFRDNSGERGARPDEGTRYGFLKGHVTDRFFYLLFSGRYFRSAHQFFGNKILVYDWEGNPIKQINLKNDIIDFAVSSDDKTLYMLNGQTKSISFSEIE